MSSSIKAFLRGSRYIIIPILLISMLVASIFILNSRITHFFEQQTISGLLEDFSTQIDLIENVIDIQFKILTTFSSSIKVKIDSLELEVVVAQMNELVQTTDFDAVYFITREGTQLSNTSVASNASSKPYFTDIMSGKRQSFISTETFNGTEKLVFSVPVYVNGSIFSVLAATMPKSKLVKYLSAELFSETMTCCICDAEGNIILKHEDSILFSEDSQTFKSVLRNYSAGLFKANGYQTFTMSTGQKILMAAQAMPNLKDWVFYSTIPYSVISDMTAKVGLISGIALGIVVTVSATLLFWFYITDKKQKAILEKDKEDLIVTEEMYRLIEDLTSSVIFRYNLVSGVFQFNSKIKGTIKTILEDDSVHNMADFRAVGDKLDIKSKVAFQRFCDDLINPSKLNGTLDVLHMENSTPLWFKLSFNSILDSSGSLIATVGKIEDVTDEIVSLDNLQHQAEHDMLTGLLNHSSASERIEQAISRDDCGLCVLAVLDIDDFKAINDRFGHAMGDDALVLVSSELAKMVIGKLDVAGRYGGDEFIILFTRLESNEEARVKISSMCEKLQTMSSANNLPVTTTVSIGASILHKGMTFQELFNEADIALYQSKRNGKNRFTFYDETITVSDSAASIPKRQMASDFSLPLYALFQRLHAAIIVLDVSEYPVIKLKYSNQTMYKYMPSFNDQNVDKEAILGTLKPAYRQRCLQALESCMSTREESTELVQLTNSTSWYSLTISMAEKSSQGQQLAIVLMTNVTPFIKRYNDLESILSRIPGAFLMFSYDAKASSINISSYNQSMLEMVGCSHDDVEYFAKTNFIPLFDDEEYSKLMKDIETIYRTKKPLSAVYRSHKINSRQTLVFQTSSVYLSDTNSILSTFTDLTELYQANQSLLLEKEKGAMSIQLTGNTIWDIDMREKVLTIKHNGESLRLEGFPESLLKDNLVHPDSATELYRLWEQLFTSSSGNCLLKARFNTSSYAWHKLTFTVKPDKSYAIALVTIQDFIVGKQSEFQRYELLASHLAVNRIGALKLNLSKFKVEGCWGYAFNASGTAGSMPNLQQVTKRFNEICINDEKKESLKSILNIGKLISFFENEQRWLSFPCSIRINPSDPVMSAVLMARLTVEPLSGNLYCLACLKDAGSIFTVRSHFVKCSYIKEDTGLLAKESFIALASSVLPFSKSKSVQYSTLTLLRYPSLKAMKDESERSYDKAIEDLAINLTLLIDSQFIFCLLDDNTFAFFRPTAKDLEHSMRYAKNTISTLEDFISPILDAENPVYQCGLAIQKSAFSDFNALMNAAQAALAKAEASSSGKSCFEAIDLDGER